MFVNDLNSDVISIKFKGVSLKIPEVCRRCGAPQEE